MPENFKKVPDNWNLVFDSEAIRRSIFRISYEIIEKHPDLQNIAIVGIKTAGEFIARRIQERIKEIEGKELPFGSIDISLYRDDLVHEDNDPTLNATELPFKVAKTKIILVDDVLYSGRTIRAALDALTDFGRPKSVQLAVLADRGHREFPIRADFVGKNLPTHNREFVRVRLKEMNYEDGVYLISK
ncbi:UNVERIFIED_CONTAM: hypothetical protein GTU68_043630 [Idotea baltica]|nr:hypothetical protein [Idotea baltica]